MSTRKPRAPKPHAFAIARLYNDGASGVATYSTLAAAEKAAQADLEYQSRCYHSDCSIGVFKLLKRYAPKPVEFEVIEVSAE